VKIFRVSLQDNESYAFREFPTLTEYQRLHQEIIPDISGNSRAGLRRCEKCGELLAKWEETLAGLIIKKRKYDVSVTYDGIVVVSRQFMEVFDHDKLEGLLFERLPDDPVFYRVLAKRAVEFDAQRRMTSFTRLCPECGRFASVIGATPVYLKPGFQIGVREFVRSDLEFGSNDGKHPLLLCGEIAAKTLSAATLKGLVLCGID
jgi:hypothetical protein